MMSADELDNFDTTAVTGLSWRHVVLQNLLPLSITIIITIIIAITIIIITIVVINVKMLVWGHV